MLELHIENKDWTLHSREKRKHEPFLPWSGKNTVFSGLQTVSIRRTKSSEGSRALITCVFDRHAGHMWSSLGVQFEAYILEKQVLESVSVFLFLAAQKANHWNFFTSLPLIGWLPFPVSPKESSYQLHHFFLVIINWPKPSFIHIPSFGHEPVALFSWCWERLKTGGEDEMVGWHHRLNGHEFEQAPEVGDGQGTLACCRPRGHRVAHDWATELSWQAPAHAVSTSCSVFPRQGFPHSVPGLWKQIHDAQVYSRCPLWISNPNLSL